MSFEDAIRAKIKEHIQQMANELKTTIEYEFSVEYGDINLGEPTVTEDSITFDLSGLSDYEKQLLNDIYYDNAKKRRQKGGE